MRRWGVAAAVGALSTAALLWAWRTNDQATSTPIRGESQSQQLPGPLVHERESRQSDLTASTTQPARQNEPTPTSKKFETADVAALKVMTSSNPLTDRLREIETILGARANAINAFKAEAKYACTALSDQGLQSTAEEDGTKLWAIEEWKALCEGLQDGQLRSIPTVDVAKSQQLLSLVNRGNREEANLLANEVIFEALSVGEIQAGVHALLETGALDLKSLNPNFKFVPNEERLQAIGMAGQLVLCSRSGGCGPGSLQTAVFCTHRGCPPGVDYERALVAALPARQMDLIRALSSWLQNRVGVGNS